MQKQKVAQNGTLVPPATASINRRENEHQVFFDVACAKATMLKTLVFGRKTWSNYCGVLGGVAEFAVLFT